MTLLPPPRPDDDADEADVSATLGWRSGSAWGKGLGTASALTQPSDPPAALKPRVKRGVCTITWREGRRSHAFSRGLLYVFTGVPQLYKTYLVTVVHRHMHMLMPHFRRWLVDAGKDVLLHEQVRLL